MKNNILTPIVDLRPNCRVNFTFLYYKRSNSDCRLTPYGQIKLGV